MAWTRRATHLASWGITTVAPDLCHASVLDLDQAANGEELAVPVVGLVGDPGTCNVWSNFLPLFDAMPDARVLRVTQADHCDFEPN